PLKNGYHERIAEKIETSQIAGGLPLSDLAYHYAQAGNKEKAVKYALAAGKDALARFGNSEAARHFTYVIDTALDEPKYANERAQALEGLGDSLFARSLFEEATKVFEQVSHTAESGVAKLRALRKAMTSSRWRGDIVHSLELAARAQDLATFDRLEYGRVRMLRGIVTGLRGNVEEGLMDLEDALRVFEEEYSLSDLAAALRESANFYVSDFQVEKALRMVMRSIAMCEDLKDFREQMETYFTAGNIFFNCALNNDALDSYKKAIEVGEKIGDYNTIAWVYVYSGCYLNP
ncbi:MAG: hypothetical protein V1909_05010, partial [Candidatus Micrarchaeota archaeon]